MALPIALVLALALQEPFVPALQHGSKSVAQWIEELAHGSHALDAVWSLYYADERSPEVIAALRSALADSRAADCRMAADSILSQWRVEHALLPAEVYSGGATLEQYLAGLGPPIASRAGGRDALRELLRSEEGATWACAHAGSAWFDVLGERLASVDSLAHELDEHPAFRKQLASNAPGLTAALPWIDRMIAIGKPGWSEWLALSPSMPDWNVEMMSNSQDPFMWLNNRTMEPDPDTDPFLEAHYFAEAQATLAKEAPQPVELLRLQAAAQRYPRVAELCLRTRPERLDRDAETGLETLRILGALGSRDPGVRTAYLRTLREWKRLDFPGLQEVPCWKRHDAETRSAFLALLARAEEPYGLHEQVRLSGELDAGSSEIARKYLERTQGATAWLVSEGFRGAVAVDKTLSLARQVNQISLNIATKQGLGQDYAEDERQLVAILERPYDRGGAGGYDDQVQWGLFHAQELGLRSRALVRVALHYIEIGDTWDGFSTHLEAAVPYLESIPLEIEDHLALRKLRPPDQAEPDWRGINIVDEHFGGEPVSKLSLEDVSRWRRKIFAGEPRFLANLLRVTPLTEREEPYLLALLERGTTEQRLFALWLVGEFRLGTAGVRAALARSASGDLDASVRRKAHLLEAPAAAPR